MWPIGKGCLTPNVADRQRLSNAKCGRSAKVAADASVHQVAWSSSSLLLSNLELSDTKVYESEIRALLGTASHFCEVVVLKLWRTVKGCGGRIAAPSGT